MSIREEVTTAFDLSDGGTYNHVLPFRYTNFIDGMAWVGTLAGAAAKAGDGAILYYCEVYLRSLIDAGKDTRNFAPMQVKPEWVKYDHGWRKVKPQSFAGPAALYFAIDSGADIIPEWVESPYSQAKLYCFVAPLFGYAIRYIKALRQHVNSAMFAHMLLHRRPPMSMHFLAENNPLYSYLYREKCNAVYKNSGAWPAKDWPGTSEYKEQVYTPTCQMAADFLQSTL